MSVPTKGEKFAELTEYLRKAQEAAAMLGHLSKANDEELIGTGWLGVAEMLEKTVYHVTKLATRGLQ